MGCSLDPLSLRRHQIRIVRCQRQERTLSFGETMGTILDETRRVVLATDAQWARTPWRRFMGLMGRRRMASGEALIFPGTKQVHTHFMCMAIDVVFYDREQRVEHLVHAMRPWRFSAHRRAAVGVIELPAGTLELARTQVGDQLRFS